MKKPSEQLRDMCPLGFAFLERNARLARPLSDEFQTDALLLALIRLLDEQHEANLKLAEEAQ